MKFFEMRLRESGSRRREFCWFEFLGDRMLGQAPVCTTCGAAIGPRPTLPPFELKIEGRIAGDICSSGFGSQFLVSDKFIAAWTNAGLSGLNMERASPTIHAVNREIEPAYLMTRPANTLTLLDEVASGLVVHKRVGCSTCGVAQRSRVERIRIREDTWDRSDIFFPSGLFGVLLVTERFVEFVRSADLSNFIFVHQDQYREQTTYDVE